MNVLSMFYVAGPNDLMALSEYLKDPAEKNKVAALAKVWKMDRNRAFSGSAKFDGSVICVYYTEGKSRRAAVIRTNAAPDRQHVCCLKYQCSLQYCIDHLQRCRNKYGELILH